MTFTMTVFNLDIGKANLTSLSLGDSDQVAEIIVSAMRRYVGYVCFLYAFVLVIYRACFLQGSLVSREASFKEKVRPSGLCVCQALVQ